MAREKLKKQDVCEHENEVTPRSTTGTVHIHEHDDYYV